MGQDILVGGGLKWWSDWVVVYGGERLYLSVGQLQQAIAQDIQHNQE
jgi:hypothetical protein